MPVVEEPSVRVPTFLDSKVDCSFVVNIPRMCTNRTTWLQFPYAKNVAKLLFPPPFKHLPRSFLQHVLRKSTQSEVSLCLVVGKGQLQAVQASAQAAVKSSGISWAGEQRTKLSCLSASKTWNWCWKRADFVTSAALGRVWDFGAFDTELLPHHPGVHRQCCSCWGSEFRCLILWGHFPYRSPASWAAPVSKCVLFSFHGQLLAELSRRCFYVEPSALPQCVCKDHRKTGKFVFTPPPETES